MKKLNDTDLQQLSILLLKLNPEKLKLSGLQIFQLVNIELGVRGYELTDNIKSKLQQHKVKTR